MPDEDVPAVPFIIIDPPKDTSSAGGQTDTTETPDPVDTTVAPTPADTALKAGMAGKYSNPVWTGTRPDPSLFRVGDTFYASVTGGKMPRGKSKDLVHWTKLSSDVLSKKPDYLDGAPGCWAPDIEYINGQYVVFYCQKVGTAPIRSMVGACVGSSMEGSFRDMGLIFHSDDLNCKGGCLDPFFWSEDGRNYLFYGSFKGVFGFEMEADGITPKNRKQYVKQIAGNKYEGGMIYKRGDYYYLFTSIDHCCQGPATSNYKIAVGRSTSLWGPYLNKSGGRMLDNQHEVILTGNDHFVAPGHNSELVVDDVGDTWMLYHAYDVKANPTATNRVMLLDKVSWTADGWPYMGDGHPSETADAPVFRNQLKK